MVGVPQDLLGCFNSSDGYNWCWGLTGTGETVFGALNLCLLPEGGSCAGD